jgi:hypothetical protein
MEQHEVASPDFEQVKACGARGLQNLAGAA